MKSWPKETARTAGPASLPEWLRLPSADAPPKLDTRRFFVRLLFCAFGPLALALVLMTLKPWVGAPLGIALILGSALVSVFTIRAGVSIIPRHYEKERRSRTLDALTEKGEPTLDGEVIGVAYAEGLWTYPHRIGHDADLGVVRFDFDRLSFVGGETRFELPAAAIVGTEIRRHEGLGDVRARLYIHWREGERSGTLSLGLPFDAPGRHVRATLALRERIEAWRREPFPRRTAPCDLPPSVEPVAVVVSVPKTGRAAKVLAGLATLLILGGVEALVTGVKVLLGGSGWAEMWGGLFILSIACWTVLPVTIEKRLPARWRYPEAETSPETLPVGAREDETVRISAG